MKNNKYVYILALCIAFSAVYFFSGEDENIVASKTAITPQVIGDSASKNTSFEIAADKSVKTQAMQQQVSESIVDDIPEFEEAQSAVLLDQINPNIGRQTDYYQRSKYLFDEYFTKVEALTLRLSSLQGDCDVMNSVFQSEMKIIGEELTILLSGVQPENTELVTTQRLSAIEALREDTIPSLSQATEKIDVLFSPCRFS